MKQLRHNFKDTALALTAGICFFVLIMSQSYVASAGTLSCSVTTSAACTGTVIYRMSSSTNAHAELPSQSNAAYDNNVVCCTNVIGLGNSCAGTASTSLKLSSTTNAHAEQNTFSNFPDNACISVPAGGSVTVGYQASNCTGYDTTLGSMENSSNSHVGDTTAYTTKICATASGVPQTISFSISDNTIGFGTLSSAQTRYATGDTLGDTADTADAHTISIASNASSGYTMTIDGSTLTCSSCGNGATISAAGASPVAPSINSEQYGVRMVVNSGTGSTTYPYSTSSWALDTASFPDPIVSGAGDSVTSVYGVRYMSNIATLSEAGIYSAIITYTVTASF
jgi:hypothetical protein